MLKRRLVWLIPVLNGIAVGLVLWAMDGFDVNHVLGAWEFIGVMLVGYALFVAGLPTYEPNDDAPMHEMTPVQRRFVDAASSLKPTK